MVLFFYYYLADVVLELLLVSNIIPSSSSIYKVIMNQKTLAIFILKKYSILLHYMLEQFVPRV